MKFIFSTEYSEEELKWIEEHNCKIMSEIKLSRTDFKENEIPRRMFNYGGSYIGEIFDKEENEFIWAELSKFKGVYRFSTYWGTLDSLEQGL
ncbi:MAG: hypothetical protein K2K02_07925 [Ruminococcus sp.]|nr:hypothetical protein [Ruminococcus sp.]